MKDYSALKKLLGQYIICVIEHSYNRTAWKSPYLTACRKYSRASVYRAWLSRAWPTLLNSLALRWLTRNPALKMDCSDSQSKLRTYVFSPWKTNNNKTPKWSTFVQLKNSNRQIISCGLRTIKKKKEIQTSIWNSRPSLTSRKRPWCRTPWTECRGHVPLRRIRRERTSWTPAETAKPSTKMPVELMVRVIRYDHNGHYAVSSFRSSLQKYCCQYNTYYDDDRVPLYESRPDESGDEE